MRADQLIALGQLAVVAALGFLAWKLVGRFRESIKGTSYQDAGAIGYAGHAANELSGGTLGQLGSNLGGLAYDWLHPTADKYDTYIGVAVPGSSTLKAVRMADIDGDGFWFYQGTRYRVAKVGVGAYQAVPA